MMYKNIDFKLMTVNNYQFTIYGEKIGYRINNTSPSRELVIIKNYENEKLILVKFIDNPGNFPWIN